MTHDPLCPYEPERWTKCTHGLDADGFASIESITTDVCQDRHHWPETPCECDFVAEIRDSESKAAGARAKEAVETFLKNYDHTSTCDCLACESADLVVDAVVGRHIEGYFPEPNRVRADALRDAVLAIEELPCRCEHADYCDGNTDAILAIEKLRSSP